MNFHILTLFPDMIMQGLSTSITGRAIQQNKITVEAVNIRDFSDNKHHKVDDYTYGGGAGMLMQAAPVYAAWESVCRETQHNAAAESNIAEGSNAAAEINESVEAESTDNADKQQRKARVRTVYVTPQGRCFDQRMAENFAKEENLVILCGHYEGVDERVLEEIVTDYVSIGDYVLTGGELAAMVIVDAVSRLVPGVLHNEESAQTETFSGDLLEYPQYTQPRVWHGKAVPDVLLSGNERNISKWRLEQSAARTKERRPDLYAKYERLQKCKELLMKQKILHIDMIELINRRRAELLFWEGTEILLRDVRTGCCFHTCMKLPNAEQKFRKDALDTEQRFGIDTPEAEQRYEKDAPDAEQQFWKPVQDTGLCDYGKSADTGMQFYKKIAPEDLQKIECITVHQDFCAEELEKSGHFRVADAYYQAACTRREMLPVSGLYRADGTPMEDGPNRGLQIRRVTPEYTDIVSNQYHLEHEEDYIRERMEAGAVYGAFFGDELVGFIGYHAEGSTGMLEVFPQYRHRHIALALETYLINLSLSRGEIPYGQIMPDNEASIELQRRMGIYLSQTPIFWMDKAGGVGYWKAVRSTKQFVVSED